MIAILYSVWRFELFILDQNVKYLIFIKVLSFSILTIYLLFKNLFWEKKLPLNFLYTFSVFNVISSTNIEQFRKYLNFNIEWLPIVLNVRAIIREKYVLYFLACKAKLDLLFTIGFSVINILIIENYYYHDDTWIFYENLYALTRPILFLLSISTHSYCYIFSGEMCVWEREWQEN